MTGPEHYREAEGLLCDVTAPDGTITAAKDGEAVGEILAAAQVHATLALAYAHLERNETVLNPSVLLEFP